ncbi:MULTISPECIES: SusC/RagA family TonB-linked outer membrane protein [Arenibacter]|uniref:SusC/RagA family TonB-linked outer membrane protein n=1 Tax=Arenibacter TaxID=178469 RepID=UPI000857B2C2|nr:MULTISPECIES: TonB-dependent receptor [Arenibacter]GBF21658.1 tonB dependent receptor [Arenibacter sp. NBRC 103722]
MKIKLTNRPPCLFGKVLLRLFMKSIIFLFCSISFALSPLNGEAQNAEIIIDSDVTLNVKQVFRLINKQTDYKFIYRHDLIKTSPNIDLKKGVIKAGDLLDKALSPLSFTYNFTDDGTIVVKKSPTNSVESSSIKILDKKLQFQVSGTVTDVDGSPLPGANIIEKGTSNGVTADFDGKFSMEIASENAVLIVSYIGFSTKEVTLSGQTDIVVSMEEDAAGLEEVVVVGYGTQKKENLTGSVATVSSEELIKRPSANVENLLQGRVPGLQVSSSSGKPGDEGNTLRIRGIGTFSGAGSNPLVLINGISGDMTNLDPNDIESVSVLKDAASSAIYGARAANGVILITTKQGKAGSLVIDYHGNIQAQSASRLPELLYNSADYMQFWNEARARNGQAPHFTQAEIDGFRNNPNDPVNYPNFNWIDHTFNTAIVNNQSFRISGGNENTVFSVSLGYLDQPGITSNYEYQRFNGRVTVDSRLNDWIKIGGDIQFVNKDITRSNWDNNVDYQILAIYGAAPNYTPTMTLPDGSTGYVARYSSDIAEWTVRNPDAQDASGLMTETRYNVLPQFYSEINLTKDLTWNSKYALTIDNNQYKNHEHAVDNYYFKDGSYAHNNATWRLGVNDIWTTSKLSTFYSTLNFTKNFEDHNLSVLIGYNQEGFKDRYLRGQRINFPTNDLKELDAGASNGQSTGGGATEWAIQSYFGRATYDYQGKYLLEANARYDGTSRISPDTRWGFFPSLSAGWRVSEEAFMENVDWLDNFKIRASWGQLGNQNVGLYPYQEVLSTTSYPFISSEPGVIQNRMVDRNLKWETTTMTDIGVDFSMLNGLFSFTFDWYNKVTDDILYQIPVPASIGLSAPTVNFGKMKNTGIDLVVGSQKSFGDFSYSASINYSSYKNEVLEILSPTYGNTTTQVGLPFNSHYLVEFDGIFQNQAEIDAAPIHPFNPKPGDLKFKDADNNGTINADDRVVIEGAYPKSFYGGTVDLSYKNFDLSLFFQGVEGSKAHVQTLAWGLTPYMQGSPPTVDFVNNRWTGEGSTNSHPAMFVTGYGPVTGTPNTYWLLDSSYLRLKNLSIGYNIPKELCQTIGLQGVNVYMSGDNLFTFTKWPGSDPEKANTGWFTAYPQLTTYTMGVKLKI